jgi:hypothetical protein
MEDSKKQKLLDKMRGYSRDRRMSAHEAMQHTPTISAQPTGSIVVFNPSTIFLHPVVLQTFPFNLAYVNSLTLTY